LYIISYLRLKYHLNMENPASSEIESSSAPIADSHAQVDVVENVPAATEQTTSENSSDVTPSTESADPTPSENETSMKRKSSDEDTASSAVETSDPSEPATRESVIASITLPEGFDLSTAVTIPFNVAAYPTTNLLHFIAGLKELWKSYFPGATFYVGGMNEASPFVAVVGENVDEVKDYVTNTFTDQSQFDQSAVYSASIFDSLPTKKRSRFGAADPAASIVQLPTQGYQPQGYGAVAPTSSTEELIYLPEDKVRLVLNKHFS
jgi:hypothetical protein